MAIAAVGNNLITYVINEMHFSLSKSANVVTNFVGTIFILALLGGYLSDSYLGCFWTILIFGFVELSVSYRLSLSLYSLSPTNTTGYLTVIALQNISELSQHCDGIFSHFLIIIIAIFCFFEISFWTIDWPIWKLEEICYK